MLVAALPSGLVRSTHRRRAWLQRHVYGTSLVAITISLPELVVAIAAVRSGAFDLAVGNLFGSNAFDMAAFLFADLA